MEIRNCPLEAHLHNNCKRTQELLLMRVEIQIPFAKFHLLFGALQIALHKDQFASHLHTALQHPGLNHHPTVSSGWLGAHTKTGRTTT